MSKTERNCTDKIKRICSACRYMIWYDKCSVSICEISGKIIMPNYYCDIPNEILKAYIGEICRPKMKGEL